MGEENTEEEKRVRGKGILDFRKSSSIMLCEPANNYSV